MGAGWSNATWLLNHSLAFVERLGMLDDMFSLEGQEARIIGSTGGLGGTTEKAAPLHSVLCATIHRSAVSWINKFFVLTGTAPICVPSLLGMQHVIRVSGKVPAVTHVTKVANAD